MGKEISIWNVNISNFINYILKKLKNFTTNTIYNNYLKCLQT